MGISLGLVGLGAFGSVFAPLFKVHPMVDRVALCDREPDRIRKFSEDPAFRDKLHSRDIHDSLDSILQSDLDALVIITQPWLHAEQAVKAMEAGKHVYSAVPVVSLPDGEEILDWCDRIVETCAKTGMYYMLGETTYYRPQTMYCRKRAAGGEFGDFIYAEGEYLHDVDSPYANLREVMKARTSSESGKEWLARAEAYREEGIVDGAMHYPTHSTSGPISVMKTHALKVSAWPYHDQTGDPMFSNHVANETALFKMANGATMRICEYRQIGHYGREIFRIYGNRASFENDHWCDKEKPTRVEVESMYDSLPEEVQTSFESVSGMSQYGGHGGSHPYLVHEFVDAIANDRQPAINAWEAARYMACGVMAHKSALRDGEVLEVPDWGNAPGTTADNTSAV